MSNSLEPPVLLSRLITFVFAAALVVVVALIVTLAKIYPLNKTQIFFLTTQPRADLEIKLTDFSPDQTNLEIYKQAFAKEYIKTRNEIIPNAAVMREKWGTDGMVYTWSTTKVYDGLRETRMWNAYMTDVPDFEFYCPVEFDRISLRARSGNTSTYAVSFKYFCTNSDGQIDKKDYTIILKLELENTIKWADRIHNPLGIRVSEYSIESGNGDPLDFR